MNLLKLAEEILDVALPTAARPFVHIAIQALDSNGDSHTLTSEELEETAARETAAGQSIGRAAHLAGLREHIELIVSRMSSGRRADMIDAIYKEVVRRMP